LAPAAATAAEAAKGVARASAASRQIADGCLPMADTPGMDMQ